MQNFKYASDHLSVIIFHDCTLGIEARNFYLLVSTLAGEILATLQCPFLYPSGLKYLLLVEACATIDFPVISRATSDGFSESFISKFAGFISGNLRYCTIRWKLRLV